MKKVYIVINDCCGCSIFSSGVFTDEERATASIDRLTTGDYVIEGELIEGPIPK